MSFTASRQPLLWTVLVAALLLVMPSEARAAGKLVDEATGWKFDAVQTLNGTTYQCLGVGVRKAFVFINVYAAVFCMEPPAMKSIADAAKGRPASALTDDQAFFDAIASAPGNKLVIMHLVRDIKREDLAKAFRESLGRVLSPEKVEKLIAVIPGDPRNGEDVKVSSNGSVLTIDIAGRAQQVDDAEIARNIFLVWLGKEAVSPTLKASIAQRAAAGQ